MNTKKTFSMVTSVMMLSLIASMPMLGFQQAAAEVSVTTFYPDTTGSSQSIAGTHSSVNVAVIGGPGIQHGGSIPQPGGFAYTNIVTANPLPALGGFDTVILNAASSFVDCDLSGNIAGGAALSVADLATLVAFVQAGGKMLIYDSECNSNDFTWLPTNLAFTTSNPGPAGAAGQSLIVEQNVLSTTGGTNPIDVVNICAQDQCGDANVMIALGSELCKDMDADNILLPNFEPVHVYSKSGGASGLGLIIYNGFDYDFAGNADLQLLTLYELQANFNPHDPSLICGTPIIDVVGGEALAINTTALILAGAQTNAVWIMSALAVIGSVAFGALYITSKKN